MAPSWTALPAGRDQPTPCVDVPKEKRGVFVYGTLMTGFAPHAALAHGLVSARPGQIRGYRMVHLPAGYPALFEDPAATAPIRGELLEFESLEAVLPGLDAYERCVPDDPASLYQRVEVDVEIGKNIYNAWCYVFLAHGVDEVVEMDGEVVLDGDWRALMESV